MIESIIPKDEAHWLSLRTNDVTSTESAALFGLSPYVTQFELWHRKRDKSVIEFDPNERTTWGNRLQDAIAEGISKDHGFPIRKMPEYMRHPQIRMGSSFDYSVQAPAIVRDRSGETPDTTILVDEGLLEIKNVDSLIYRGDWTVDGDNIEAPPHIEMQVQHQLGLTGRKFAYIGALIGGNRVVLIKREPDERIIEQIMDRIDSFWSSVNKGSAPLPDFKKDSAFIARLYQHAEPGKFVDFSERGDIVDLATQYKTLGDQIKGLDVERDAIKAQLIMQLGDAEKAQGDGFSITAGSIAATVVPSYERKAYRTFRVNWPKPKKEIL